MKAGKDKILFGQKFGRARVIDSYRGRSGDIARTPDPLPKLFELSLLYRTLKPHPEYSKCIFIAYRPDP